LVAVTKLITGSKVKRLEQEDQRAD
jgi:hypothetical protein